MQIAAVSKDGQYMTTQHASALTDVDLSAATELGEYAFALCKELVSVKLGDGVTELKQYTFAGCDKLAQINLGKLTAIGEYCFMETMALEYVDLSSAVTIGDYAFVNSQALHTVELKPVTEESPETVFVGEGAFAYCAELVDVEYMQSMSYVGDHAFAYAGVSSADLTGAEHIGTQAFIKEELTSFVIALSDKLQTLGDNPFAMCQLRPFQLVEESNFNGTVTKTPIYTYDISETVKVIDGSLYCKVDTGLELITYAGVEHGDIQVADGTVRISAMAFAGSDAKMVTLPYTVAAIGHKAFYDCDSLEIVIFQSYNAPILEEEFDPAYYDCLEHMPGSGDYGTYTDYDGTEVTIEPMGMLPYFMWNATGGMYSNVYYGANFDDYVGYVTDKLMLVHPVNGQHYDTFIMGQYFDLALEGAAAADDVTLAAIKAINSIPERVVYEDKASVETARAAYDKIATIAQQALVSNYDKLLQAEQRVLALTPTEEVEPEPQEQPQDTTPWGLIIGIVIGVLVLAGGAVAFFLLRKRSAEGQQPAILSKINTLLEGLKKPEAEPAEEAPEQPEQTEPQEAADEEETSEE